MINKRRADATEKTMYTRPLLGESLDFVRRPQKELLSLSYFMLKKVCFGPITQRLHA